MKNVEKPLVSVVMITKNREGIMLHAIESIIAQTYTNFEFIILDGGSEDNSQSILSEYASKDSRIKWMNFPTNNYIVAYSKVLTLCTGEYICFIESDDLYSPNKIECQLNYLLNHNNIDVVSCTTLFNSNCGIASTVNELTNTQITNLVKENDIHLICHFPSTMIRKTALDKVFPNTNFYFYPEFCEGHGGDAFLYTLLYKGCKFANVSECMYIYRLGVSKSDSLTCNISPVYFNENILGKDQRARKKCINGLYKKYIVSNE